MPNIKSAKKRVLVNETKRANNQVNKTALKTEMKKVEAAVAANDKELAASELKCASKTIDKAAAKGILHKKTAARRKSKLARHVNNIAE